MQLQLDESVENRSLEKRIHLQQVLKLATSKLLKWWTHDCGFQDPWIHVLHPNCMQLKVTLGRINTSLDCCRNQVLQKIMTQQGHFIILHYISPWCFESHPLLHSLTWCIKYIPIQLSKHFLKPHTNLLFTTHLNDIFSHFVETVFSFQPINPIKSSKETYFSTLVMHGS